jgi:hypothetical protein
MTRGIHFSQPETRFFLIRFFAGSSSLIARVLLESSRWQQSSSAKFPSLLDRAIPEISQTSKEAYPPVKHPCIIALLFVVATSLLSRADEPKEAVTKDVALKAIATFREEPMSERATVAAAILVRFARESPDVAVTASPALIPWMEAKPLPKESSILLTAYIAGSVRAQLESGHMKNDAVAGEEQVIETYQKLQQTTPTLHIDSVEKLVDLQKQGKLKETFDSK